MAIPPFAEAGDEEGALEGLLTEELAARRGIARKQLDRNEQGCAAPRDEGTSAAALQQ